MRRDLKREKEANSNYEVVKNGQFLSNISRSGLKSTVSHCEVVNSK